LNRGNNSRSASSGNSNGVSSARRTIRRLPSSVQLPPRKKNTSRMHNASVTFCLFDGNDSTLYTSGAVDGLIKGWDMRALSTSRKRKHHECKFSFSPRSWVNYQMDTLGEENGSRRVPSPNVLSFQSSSTSFSASSCSSSSSSSSSNSNHHFNDKRQHGISCMSLDSTKSRLLVSYLGVGMYEYNIYGSTPYIHKPRHYNGHRQSSFYVRSSFGPNDQAVISGSTSGSIFVWDR
jgi:WD40 repeat protein